VERAEGAATIPLTVEEIDTTDSVHLSHYIMVKIFSEVAPMTKEYVAGNCVVISHCIFKHRTIY